jgi:hypothetical protein
MKAGDKVIYFQPKGFDTPVHRTATITGLTESQIDGKRAFILIDPTDPEDLPFRDWVRQSSLQPYSDALWSSPGALGQATKSAGRDPSSVTQR